MKTIAACTLLALFAAACAGEARQTAEPKLSSAQAPGWPTLGAGASRFIRIDLGPDSFAECQKISPKFPFDSAETYAQDREQIGALATCLNAPGMRDRTILLVGRADASGTDGYNEGLGMKRANAIRQILIDGGIAESRISMASEGERGAVGHEPEYAPGYDRRVDVIVRGGTHAP